MQVLARSFVLVLTVAASAPVIGQWSTATLSVGRLAAATTVGTKAMFMGPQPSVDIYDDSTGTWSWMATANFDLNYCRATTVGSKALFASDVCCIDMVAIYDDATGTWSTAQPGETWSFQAWYRDVSNTNNFTDAVSITFN